MESFLSDNYFKWRLFISH